MGLENATNINSLNENNPLGTDPRSQGDDHIRMIKSVLKSDVFAASLANGSTDKATPVDADLLLIADSAASYGRKKLTWANLKAAIKSYYDSVTATLTNKTISGANNTLSDIGIGSITMNTGKLLGRTSSGTGGVEEIGVSGPLALTGGALTTSMNTGKLLGRTSSNSGVVEEISVGGDLSLSSGVLSVSGVPVGTIMYFSTSTPPSGWLKANGAAISRTTYSALFSVIGTTFGAGNGSTTFNLPDLRGVFPRGWDDWRGLDSGRAFGSYQADELKSHAHSYATFDAGSRISVDINYSGYSDFSTSTTGATGGAETRPKNVALLACIKY